MPSRLDPGDADGPRALAWTSGCRETWAPSEAEFDTALRLNPGDAEILAVYSAWASAFGHPERGAEAADRAIRLNPNYPVWQAWFSYAYFCVGRFEDALRVLERLPKDNYLFYSWVLRAASYAALGRSGGGEGGLVGRACALPRSDHRGLHRDPGLERRRSEAAYRAMRAAGFPACAKPETLAKNPQLVRLPECLSK